MRTTNKRVPMSRRLFALLLVPTPLSPNNVAVPYPYSEHCSRPAPEDFDTLIEVAAGEFNIDPRVLALTVYRESDCVASAIGASGELGLGQINPVVWLPTLREAGLAHTRQDLLKPRENLRVTAFVLANLKKRYGDSARAVLARYNGSGTAARQYAWEQAARYEELWSTPLTRIGP